jgi:RNAse (barnase) inhibitor barstar
MCHSPTTFEFVDDITGFRAPDCFVARLPGRLSRKQDLLRALATGLKFPDYFGYNWDALEECLNDLSWLGAMPRVVILHNHIPLRDKEQRRIYCGILRQAIVNRRPLFRAIFPESARQEMEKCK